MKRHSIVKSLAATIVIFVGVAATFLFIKQRMVSDGEEATERPTGLSDSNAIEKVELTNVTTREEKNAVVASSVQTEVSQQHLRKVRQISEITHELAPVKNLRKYELPALLQLFGVSWKVSVYRLLDSWNGLRRQRTGHVG